jgi:organic hydroperoxide reductase OsmC/OhrA
MKPLPHNYDVNVTAAEQGHATLTSRGLMSMVSGPPAEFGGPGNLWSPETLLMAAVADCLVLTFKAVAGAAKTKWTSIDCDARGTLDRADGLVRFTAMRLHARIHVPAGTDAAAVDRLLHKAEKACLVANSLRFQPELEAEIVVDQVPELLAS